MFFYVLLLEDAVLMTFLGYEWDMNST